MDNDYIIGEEKSLKDLLEGVDLLSLFMSAAGTGVTEVIVEDSGGEILFHYGDSCSERVFSSKKAINLEGETAGHIVIKGYNNRSLINAIGDVIFNALTMILKYNYKASLAVETHGAVISKSYEELLELNRKLNLSESKYKKLANSLEKQVQERTEELKQVHARLLHQEKIASVGQLAAGMAHEINNPLSFVLSNIRSMNQYVLKFKEMLVFYRNIVDSKELSDKDRELSRQKWKNLKLDYIFSDIDELVKESLEGAERVKKIVSDLKGFSHIDQEEIVEIDINEEINRTINVLTHNIPGDAEIIKNYQTLPVVKCNPAYLRQAFLNIISNSLQTGKEGLKLTIMTRNMKGFIKINFSDNGPGIPENITSRIFEPFFTTKEVGKGTGMGLNVTHEIITSLGGTIEVESQSGKGTTFTILLPLYQEELYV